MGTFNVIITGLTVILTITSHTPQNLSVRVREQRYHLFTIFAIMRSQYTAPPAILTHTAFSPGLLNYIVPHEPLNLPNKHSLQRPYAVLSTAERRGFYEIQTVKIDMADESLPLSLFFFSAGPQLMPINSVFMVMECVYSI